MAQSKRAGGICLLVAFLAVACAHVAPTDIDSVSREAAAQAVEEWGLAKGSPREAKLRGLISQTMSSRSVQAAFEKRKTLESPEMFGARLSSEGLAYLTDDTLRQYFVALARLVNDATDTECVAFVQTESSADPTGEFRAIWRQRKARVSEADFDTLTRTPFDAMVERARRIDTPPQVLSMSEQARGLANLKPHIPAWWLADLAETEKRTNAGDPMTVCVTLRIWYTAKSRATGPDAALGLRVGLDLPK